MYTPFTPSPTSDGVVWFKYHMDLGLESKRLDNGSLVRWSFVMERGFIITRLPNLSIKYMNFKNPKYILNINIPCITLIVNRTRTSAKSGE